MITKVNVTNEVPFAQIANSLLRDKRLSLDTRGLLSMILSFPTSYRLSVENLLDEINNGVQLDKDKIGKDRLRRMTKEAESAGYLKIKSRMDNDGKFNGKEWFVYGVSGWMLPGVTSAKPKAVTPHAADHPAAVIFQETFNVNLDTKTIAYIEAEVPLGYELWRRVCMDHLSGMTQQQKDSEPFRQKAVKFCLEDYRRERDKTEQRELRSQYQTGKDVDVDHPDYKPPRKSFTEYVAEYEYGSPEYIRFRESWVERAKAKGLGEAIEEVEAHEGIQRSLAAAKERKGRVSE